MSLKEELSAIKRQREKESRQRKLDEPKIQAQEYEEAADRLISILPSVCKRQAKLGMNSVFLNCNGVLRRTTFYRSTYGAPKRGNDEEGDSVTTIIDPAKAKPDEFHNTQAFRRVRQFCQQNGLRLEIRIPHFIEKKWMAPKKEEPFEWIDIYADDIREYRIVISW